MYNLQDPLILTETYYGKTPDLQECENLLKEIRSKYNITNNGENITRSNCPEMDQFAKILEYKFNMNLDIHITTPKPLSFFVGSTMPTTGLGALMGPLFSLIPNAFTFGTGNINYLKPIEVIEDNEGIRYKEKQNVAVVCTGPLFFSKDSSPAVIMAVILHEIGHNFFLRTDVRIVRAFDQLLSASAEAYITFAAWDKIGKMAKSPRLMHMGGVIARTIKTVAAFIPALDVGMFQLLEKGFSKMERVLRAITPKTITNLLDAAFKTYRLDMNSLWFSQALIILGGVLQSLSDKSFYCVLSINATFKKFYEFYRILSPFFVSRRTDEIYADNFATLHGYGKEVAKFSETFSKLDMMASAKLIKGMDFINTIIRMITMFTMVHDPHPSNIVRAKRAADTLRNELNSGSISERDKAKILKNIEGIDSVYERMKAKGVDTLGNDLAPFNMALADYADNVISFKELIDITIDTLKGNAKLESTEIEDPCLDAKIKYICETVDMIPSVLHEGLGSIIKDLVTGDIDKEIKELQSDVRDIHTPEQQRLVVTKIVNVLERLIQLRHSPGKIETFVHDSTAMLQRLFGNRDAGKELKLRTSEAISKLAHLRDQALAKKWDNSEYNEKVAQLRDRVQELMKKAEDYDE
jgi:hypothetical protein